MESGLRIVWPRYGRTSRVWDSLFVMKSGCAGGRGKLETGKVFSPEMPFYSKFYSEIRSPRWEV